jgi:hypothetical protein
LNTPLQPCLGHAPQAHYPHLPPSEVPPPSPPEMPPGLPPEVPNDLPAEVPVQEPPPEVEPDAPPEMPPAVPVRDPPTGKPAQPCAASLSCHERSAQADSSDISANSSTPDSVMRNSAANMRGMFSW